MEPRIARGWLAAGLAIAATVYFLIAAVVTHIVSPQYDFISDYISDYAVGPRGWIYSSAFLASCLGCLALAVALWETMPPPARSSTGIILLAVVGITYAVDFVFPTDILAPGQPPQTTTGAIHLADALLGWILFVVSAFLISASAKRDAWWRSPHGVLVGLAWIATILLVILIAVAVARVPVGGLVEKAFILDRNVWALIAAIAAFRSPATAATHARSNANI